MTKRKFKKGLVIILAVSLMASLLSACSFGKSDKSTRKSEEPVEKLMAYIRDLYAAPEVMTLICKQDDLSQESNMDYYGFDEQLLAGLEGFISERAYNAKCWEYIILKTNDVDTSKAQLENYRQKRISDFYGYAPDEEKILSDSEIVVVDNYIGLFIDERTDEISDSFKDAIQNGFNMTEGAEEMLGYYNFVSDSESGSATEAEAGSEDANTEVVNREDSATETATEDKDDVKPRTKSGPNGETLIEEVRGHIDVYDTSKIVEAYKAGDKSMLTDEHDIAVYECCEKILAEIIKDDMTQLEKEKAVHNYIVSHTEYDENCLTYSNWFTEYADQPYGCLIDKHAICVGYATTFKLFMDILDIECIVVTGSATETRDNHGWNLVHLDDDNWYAVDVTWDDPVGYYGDTVLDFFNVDDEYMQLTTHHWDQNKYPEAKGGKYTRELDY